MLMYYLISQIVMIIITIYCIFNPIQILNINVLFFYQIVKNRYDGTLGKLELKFQRDRLSFRPKDRELIVSSDEMQTSQ